MKKILPILLLMLISFSISKAQSYNPFPAAKGFWKEQSGNITCLNSDMTSDICNTFQYILDGDTLIDSVNYKKIFKSGMNNGGGYFDIGFIGGLKDDTINKKVYYYNAEDDTEYLLYDFNLNQGDTFHADYFNSGMGSSNIIIGTIDSVSVSSKHAKRFQLLNAGWGSEIYLIEGIGTTMGLITPVYSYFESHNELLCFKNNDTIVFFNELVFASEQCDLISGIENNEENGAFAFPNPANSAIKINGKKTAFVRILNVFGQTLVESKEPIILLHELPKGLYFLNHWDNKGKHFKTEKLFIE